MPQPIGGPETSVKLKCNFCIQIEALRLSKDKKSQWQQECGHMEDVVQAGFDSWPVPGYIPGNHFRPNWIRIYEIKFSLRSVSTSFIIH